MVLMSSIDIKNLCSRKLWELLSIEDSQHPLSPFEKTNIELELLQRGHYREELLSWRQGLQVQQMNQHENRQERI